MRILSRSSFLYLSLLLAVTCVSSFTLPWQSSPPAKNRRQWRLPSFALSSSSSASSNYPISSDRPLQVALLLHQKVDPMAALSLLSSQGYQVTAFYLQKYENRLENGEQVALEQLCADYGVPMQVMDAPAPSVADVRQTSDYVLSDARERIKLFQQNGLDFDYVATWYQVSVQLEDRGDGIQLMQPSGDFSDGQSFLLCMLNRDQLNTLVPKQNPVSSSSSSKQDKTIFGQIVDFFVPKEKNEESKPVSFRKEEQRNTRFSDDVPVKTAVNSIDLPPATATRPDQSAPLRQQQQQRSNAAVPVSPRRQSPPPDPRAPPIANTSTSRPPPLDPLAGASRSDSGARSSSWRSSQGPPSALGPDFTGANTYPAAKVASRPPPLDPWSSNPNRSNPQPFPSIATTTRTSSSWGTSDMRSITDAALGNSGYVAPSSWKTPTEDRGQGFYGAKRVDDGGASITGTSRSRDSIPQSWKDTTPKQRPQPLQPIDPPRNEAMSAWTGSTVSTTSRTNVPARPLTDLPISPWMTESKPLQPADPPPNEAVSTWTGSTFATTGSTTIRQDPLQPSDPPPNEAVAVWTGSTPGRISDNVNEFVPRTPVSTNLQTLGRSEFAPDTSRESSSYQNTRNDKERNQMNDFSRNSWAPPQVRDGDGKQRSEPSRDWARQTDVGASIPGNSQPKQETDSTRQPSRGRPESNDSKSESSSQKQPAWNTSPPQEQLNRDRNQRQQQDVSATTLQPVEAGPLHEAVQDAFTYFSQLPPDQIRSDLMQRGEWYELEQFPSEVLVTPKTPVDGCSSRVFIQTGFFQEDKEWIMYMFQGETDATILRGLIQILSDITQEVPIGEVMSIAPHEIANALGLRNALSPSDINDMSAVWYVLQQQIQETLFGNSVKRKGESDYSPSTMGTSIPGAGSSKPETKKEWGPGSSGGGSNGQSNAAGSAPPFAIWDPTSASAQSSPAPSPPSSSPSDRLSRLDRLSSPSTPKFDDGAQVDASASRAPWDNWTPPQKTDSTQSKSTEPPSTLGTSIPGAGSSKPAVKEGWGPGSSGNSKSQSSTSGSAPPFAIWDPTSASTQSSPSPPPSSSPSDRLSRLDRLSSPPTPKFDDGAQVDISASKAPWDNWSPPAQNTQSVSSKASSNDFVARSPASAERQTPGRSDSSSFQMSRSANEEPKTGRTRMDSDTRSNRSSSPVQNRERRQRSEQNNDWAGPSDFDPNLPSVGASIPGSGQKPEVKSGWNPSRGKSESNNNQQSDSGNNQSQPPWNAWNPPPAQEEPRRDRNQRQEQESDWRGPSDFDPSQPSVGASIPGARQAAEVKSGWSPSRGKSESNRSQENESNNSQNQPPWNAWTPPAAQDNNNGADTSDNDPKKFGIDIPDFDPSRPSISSIPGAGSSKPAVKKGWQPGKK